MISLLIVIAAWLLAAGTLKLFAEHCRRGIDAATVKNEESKRRLDETFAAMQAEFDRAERVNAEHDRQVASWREFCADTARLVWLAEQGRRN